MTTAKEPSEIVSACVTGHASIDRHLARAYSEGEKMLKAVEDGLELGMIPDGMAAKDFIWSHRAALGKIADAGKAYAAVHPTGTDHAKANGADLGKITEAGGIKLPQPEFEVFGGGR